MMKEIKREDSVEAETSMANTYFLVAQHYAHGQLTRERKTANITKLSNIAITGKKKKKIKRLTEGEKV